MILHHLTSRVNIFSNQLDDMEVDVPPMFQSNSQMGDDDDNVANN